MIRFPTLVMWALEAFGGAYLLIAGLQGSSVAAVLVGSVLLMLFVLSLLLRVGLARQFNRLELETDYLAMQTMTYRPIGSTVTPDFARNRPRGYHAVERRTELGHGPEVFARAADRVLRWELKTGAGFRVIRVGAHGAFFSDQPVRSMENAIVRFGPVRETVTVVRVVSQPRRKGFAYGTLPRHPLRGEEAFLVEWHDDDRVELLIRSISKPRYPSGWLWFPLVLVAQEVFLRRYARALLD